MGEEEGEVWLRRLVGSNMTGMGKITCSPARSMEATSALKRAMVRGLVASLNCFVTAGVVEKVVDEMMDWCVSKRTFGGGDAIARVLNVYKIDVFMFMSDGGDKVRFYGGGEVYIYTIV